MIGPLIEDCRATESLLKIIYRLVSLWALFASKCRCSEERFDEFMRIATALTDSHIKLNSLRREDGE